MSTRRVPTRLLIWLVHSLAANSNPHSYITIVMLCHIFVDLYGSDPILELGAATGALSVYLASAPFLFDMYTRFAKLSTLFLIVIKNLWKLNWRYSHTKFAYVPIAALRFFYHLQSFLDLPFFSSSIF